MKAIVVLFDGDFHSSVNEKVCIETILESVLKNIDNNDNARKVKVSILEDSDIAKAVVNKAAQTPVKKSILEEYCERIHLLLGDPRFTDRKGFTQTIVAAISTRNSIILNKGALSILLSKGKMSREDSEILSKYNLSFLPSLLQEINNLIKIDEV